MDRVPHARQRLFVPRPGGAHVRESRSDRCAAWDSHVVAPRIATAWHQLVRSGWCPGPDPTSRLLCDRRLVARGVRPAYRIALTIRLGAEPLKRLVRLRGAARESLAKVPRR